MSEVTFSSVCYTPGSLVDSGTPALRMEEPLPYRGVTPLPLKTAALRSVIHVAIPGTSSESRRNRWFDFFAKGSIVLCLLAAVAVAFARNRNPLFVESPRFDFSSPTALVWQLSGLGAMAYFVLSLYFAVRYRPVQAPSDAQLPKLTVVVPAYNEGAMVRVSLLSAIENRYPADRLEILARDHIEVTQNALSLGAEQRIDLAAHALRDAGGVVHQAAEFVK